MKFSFAFIHSIVAIVAILCFKSVTAQNITGTGKDMVKPYATIVPNDAITSKGFITVHRVKDRYLFEIPDSIMERDLFTSNRLIKSGQDFRSGFMVCSYGNDWIGQAMFRFSRESGNVVIKLISTSERSDNSENGVHDALTQNTIDPIFASFPIKAYGPSHSSVVIDITDFLNSDNEIFGMLNMLKITGIPAGSTFRPERSFLTDIKAYPANIEVKSIRTFASNDFTLTGEYNSSIILLSREPMKGRKFDERVGYLRINTYKELDANGGMQTQSDIWRWRIEPKAEDREKYFKGILVEPAKPIVYYIDPATPKKWVPYLIAGVNDWQGAFEKAGFKNAIIAKEVDPADTSFDINDARHNVIVYKASAVANAMGLTLQDPRSGEIIESHIQWFHSIMEVLHRWYFTQVGAIDTAAQKPVLSDELMGQLIRFVSSHEVGHALGLRHNWGASSTTPVANLRDKKWLEAHGHTPSIMDYARFNYVAQPEDHIGRSGIFPRVGDYDTWAIEWGYKLLPPGTSADKEKEVLNQRIVEKLKISDRYRFGIGDDTSAPFPDNQSEDLGDDAMLASEYGIKNLKRILPNLSKWMQVPGEDYQKLSNSYGAVLGVYRQFMWHVIANIGGVHFIPKTVEQPGNVYTFFSREKKRRAVAFLQHQLFTTPDWLRNNYIYSVTLNDFSKVESIQKDAIKFLISPELFKTIRLQEQFDPLNAYTASELLGDLKEGIFSELKSGAVITANRRIVQNAYVNQLLAFCEEPNNMQLDAYAVVKQQGKSLITACKIAAGKTADRMTRIHLESMYERLYTAFLLPMQVAKRNNFK